MGTVKDALARIQSFAPGGASVANSVGDGTGGPGTTLTNWLSSPSGQTIAQRLEETAENLASAPSEIFNLAGSVALTLQGALDRIFGGDAAAGRAGRAYLSGVMADYSESWSYPEDGQTLSEGFLISCGIDQFAALLPLLTDGSIWQYPPYNNIVRHFLDVVMCNNAWDPSSTTVGLSAFIAQTINDQIWRYVVNMVNGYTVEADFVAALAPLTAAVEAATASASGLSSQLERIEIQYVAQQVATGQGFVVFGSALAGALADLNSAVAGLAADDLATLITAWSSNAVVFGLASGLAHDCAGLATLIGAGDPTLAQTIKTQLSTVVGGAIVETLASFFGGCSVMIGGVAVNLLEHLCLDIEGKQALLSDALAGLVYSTVPEASIHAIASMVARQTFYSVE